MVVTAFKSIVILLVHSPENHCQFAGARVAIRDRLVAAVRTPFSQLLARPTLTAAVVANPCRWVLSRNRRERLPKDTMAVWLDQLVRLLVRFDGYRGKYTFHCHNLGREDMMANFEVV
jgi:FtsP/CotA-like multicopper oxidase with cupredoxin domain